MVMVSGFGLSFCVVWPTGVRCRKIHGPWKLLLT